MPPLHVTVLHHRPVGAALADSAARFDACRDGIARLTVSTLAGPAVVLGARQHAGRVVDLDACARASTPVFRRASTGTTAYTGPRALLWSLALPDVAALLRDATRATVLNRNVRLLLRGITAAGALAHYFGREWVAVRHRPVAVLGFDITRDGRALVEAVVGWDVSIELPRALCADAELRLDRWRGRTPIALTEVLHDTTPEVYARRVADAAAARVEATVTYDDAAMTVSAFDAVTDPDDPVTGGATHRHTVEVPVGYVESARVGEALWLGGDMLCANSSLDDAAAALLAGDALPEDGALLGATWSDFARAGASPTR